MSRRGQKCTLRQYYKALILSLFLILLYDFEIWTLTVELERKLACFETTCLRRIIIRGLQETARSLRNTNIRSFTDMQTTVADPVAYQEW